MRSHQPKCDCARPPEPDPGLAGLGAGLANGSQLDPRWRGVSPPPLDSQGDGSLPGPLLLLRRGVLLQSSAEDLRRGVDSQSPRPCDSLRLRPSSLCLSCASTLNQLKMPGALPRLKLPEASKSFNVTGVAQVNGQFWAKRTEVLERMLPLDIGQNLSEHVCTNMAQIPCSHQARVVQQRGRGASPWTPALLSVTLYRRLASQSLWQPAWQILQVYSHLSIIARIDSLMPGQSGQGVKCC